MGIKRISLILIFCLVLLFLGINLAKAGFGITPYYITNGNLMRGSHFEDTVYLVRGQPDEELVAEINFDVPNAPQLKNWLSFDKGLKFPLPKGEQQVPLKVIVDVPKDADLGVYKGYIIVRAIRPSTGEGGVSNIVGGRIDVSLVVTEKGFSDFNVRAVSIPRFEKGQPMPVLVILENTGNIPAKPSKVQVDIYDLSHVKLLRSGEITEMQLVDPFLTAQSKGELKNNLDVGEYWADVTVFKEETAVGTFNIYFTVVPEGTLKKEEAKQVFGKNDYKLALITILIVSAILIWTNRDKIKKIKKR